MRRGYFVEGLGASQFAVPGAEDRLRNVPEQAQAVVLAATDPANAWGHLLPWPDAAGEGPRCSRSAGARVILHRGFLLAFISQGGDQMATFLPENEPERGHAAAQLVEGLKRAARGRRQLHLAKIDGAVRAADDLHRLLLEGGFQHAYRGYSYKSDVVDLHA